MNFKIESAAGVQYCISPVNRHAVVACGLTPTAYKQLQCFGGQHVVFPLIALCNLLLPKVLVKMLS